MKSSTMTWPRSRNAPSLLYHVLLRVVVLALGILVGVLIVDLFHSIAPAALWGPASSSAGIIEILPQPSKFIHDQPNFKLKSSKRLFSEMPEGHQRKTFFCDCAWWNHKLLRAFRQLGWQKVDKAKDATVVCTEVHDPTFFPKIRSWQRHNHLPNTDVFFNDRYSIIARWNRYTQQKWDQRPYFLPDAYRLHNKHDRSLLKERMKTAVNHKPRPWVLYSHDKAPHYFMSTPENAAKVLNMEPVGSHDYSWIQQYICDTLSWRNGENMILRIFWLVASVDPLIVFYQDGYVRIGTNPDEHVGNHYTDRDALPFLDLGTYLIDYTSSKKQHFSRRVLADPLLHITRQLKETIATLVDAFGDETFSLSSSSMDRTEDAFELLAADFLLDQDLDVWLLDIYTDTVKEEEYNQFILDNRYSSLQKLHEVYYGMINVLSEIWDKQAQGDKLSPFRQAGQWQVVNLNDWRFRYVGYKRSKKQRHCKITESTSQHRKYSDIVADDDWIPSYTKRDRSLFHMSRDRDSQ